MKKSFIMPVIVLAAAAMLVAGCDTRIPRGSAAIIVNHTNWDASTIPDGVISQAQSLDVYFEHASVGNNVHNGLVTLGPIGSRYEYDGDHFEPNPERQPSPDELDDIATWFDDTNNNGIVDFMRGNPGFDSKLAWFVADMNTDVGSPTTTKFATHLDVATFKFCWIDDAYITGDAANEFGSVRTAMEALELQYPAVRFVWWTMPLFASGSANAVRLDYNTRVRNYCAANNKPLIDIADIECHDPSDNLVTDGSGNEVVYIGYHDGDGGHLSALGEARMANAWWVMLARVSGWEP